MSNLFKFHKLNELGQEKAQKIQLIFENCLIELENACSNETGSVGGREFSIAMTKLEEACFFAKKAMATQSFNRF